MTSSGIKINEKTHARGPSMIILGEMTIRAKNFEMSCAFVRKEEVFLG